MLLYGHSVANTYAIQQEYCIFVGYISYKTADESAINEEAHFRTVIDFGAGRYVYSW